MSTLFDSPRFHRPHKSHGSHKSHSLRLACLLFLALLPAGLLAQAPADPSAQLRDALRSTTLQLRTAQADLATVQAQRDQARDDLAGLEKRLDALSRQAAADLTAARTNLANLNRQLADKDAEAARLAAALKLALDERDQAARLAAERKEQHSLLDRKHIEAEREIADLRRRNRNLFQIGSDVLTRYENFGLGRALQAREPFTKLTRVKLQNEIQTHADALEENREKLTEKAEEARSGK